MKKLYSIDNYIIYEDNGVQAIFPKKESFYDVAGPETFSLNHSITGNKVILPKDGSNVFDNLDVEYNDVTLLEFLQTETSFNTAGSSASPTETDPVFTEILSNLQQFNSLQEANDELGYGKLFLYAEANYNGVVSPNGTVVGITKEIPELTFNFNIP